ncbi:nucleotidyltransferase family protein [Kutzneria kofuensis]|uniref:nucleotidyltransferase family protein n=1 Tax=Kutzneria kofuensis TaxID=103725 RepID=UPI0031E790D3
MSTVDSPSAYPELQLGCLAPAAPVGDILARVERVVADGVRRLDRVADVVRRNRVVLLAAHNLDGTTHPTGAALVAELAPFVADRRRRAEALVRTEELLERLGVALGIPVWGIKGLASRAGYPDPALRELRDADVAVAGADEAFALAEELRGHGYDTDHAELPWIKHDAGGTPYGQYKLTGPDGHSAVDIHFGPGYSAGHCGLLPVPAPTEPGLRPLPILANLRPMTGNSGGDVHVTVKDVNDLWTAAKVLDPESAAALVRDARAAALHGHLAGIARLTAEITSVDRDQREVLDVLVRAAAGRAGRPVVATGLMSRTAPVRVLRTTGRAYAQARAHTRSVPVRVAAAVTAFAFYVVNARPRVVTARCSPVGRPPGAACGSFPSGWPKLSTGGAPTPRRSGKATGGFGGPAPSGRRAAP